MRLRTITSCLLLLWITFPSYTHAQAFIANLGFEEYILCPEGNLDVHQIANWNFSFPPSERTTERPWYYQSYHHICDRDVSVYWKPVLGKGVLRVPHIFDTTTDEVKTALLWTQLLRPFEKDSLYYIEYTTAPNLFYYPPDETFYQTWCVSPTLSISLMDEMIPDVINQETFLDPLFSAEESGLAAREANTLVVGNCFRATGQERYLLFGYFRHDKTAKDERCLGSAINERFGYATTLVDNFKLEKMKLEICCDKILCSADLVDFSDYTNQYVLPQTTFIWNDGIEGVKRSFSQSGSYQLTLVAPCGSVRSNWINIEVKSECNSTVFVPNAFSPNGDGWNDFFAPNFSQDFDSKIIRFAVFNRWGEQVYRYHSTDDVWDGKIQGKEAPIGVYTWLLEYEVLIGDAPVQFTESGDLTLIR